jgi:hypothetical protein
MPTAMRVFDHDSRQGLCGNVMRLEKVLVTAWEKRP